MTTWQLLLETQLTEGQAWQLTPLTSAIEFKLDQTNVPQLGVLVITQATQSADGTLEFLEIKQFPARAESSRFVLNPGDRPIRMIGLRWRYAEWDGQPEAWTVRLYANTDLEAGVRPVTAVVEVLAQLIGGEPAGAETRARTYVDERLATFEPEGDFDPAGSATRAKTEAIAVAEQMIAALTAIDVEADSAGSATRAKTEAIAAAEQMIAALTATDVEADPAGSALLAQQSAIANSLQAIEAITPNRFSQFWPFGFVKTGAALRITIGTNRNFFTSAFQDPALLNDEIWFEFPLRKGAYNLIVTGLVSSNSGIQAVFLDDRQLGTIDWYSADSPASAVPNTSRSINNFSVPDTKLQRLRFKTTGQRVANSGYFCHLQYLRVVPV